MRRSVWCATAQSASPAARSSFVGRAADVPAGGAGRVWDLGGKVVTPGLVDPHTHIVYGEEGLIDFEVLSQGGQRWDLEPRGGGVGAMVKRTRALSEEALYEASRARMGRLIANGVTTVESKSGLHPRQGRRAAADADLARAGTRPAGHGGVDVPRRARSRAGIRRTARRLCRLHVQRGDSRSREAGSRRSGRRLLRQGGLHPRADGPDVRQGQAPTACRSRPMPTSTPTSGVGALVARHGGLSADHLEFASLASVRAMAEAGTVATLLAGAHLTLHETRRPPVEMFREFGVPIALATNSNPVSSPTVSPASQMHLACYLFKLTAEEALRGFTVNGARALGLSETAGRIAKGRAGRSRCLGHDRSTRHLLPDRRCSVPRRRSRRASSSTRRRRRPSGAHERRVKNCCTGSTRRATGNSRSCRPSRASIPAIRRATRARRPISSAVSSTKRACRIAPKRRSPPIPT